MRAAVDILFVCAVIAVSGCAEETEANCVEPVDATVDDLLSRAAIAGPDEYVRLREQCLKSACADNLSGKDLATLEDWKEHVYARAWLEWVKDPKTCGFLWNYEPPDNGFRNPYPFMAEASHQTFQAAGDRGLIIAREIMLSQRRALHGALPGLLVEDRSQLSRRVILECALTKNCPSSALALRALDPDIAHEVYSRLDDADRRCLPELILVLAHFKYEEAMPKLGARLLALRKETYIQRHGSFWYPAGSRVGTAIASYFEAVAGPQFPPGSSATSKAERIDAAKRWWNENSDRFTREPNSDTGAEQPAPENGQ